MGFSTIRGFRHPWGSWNVSPVDKEACCVQNMFPSWIRGPAVYRTPPLPWGLLEALQTLRCTVPATEKLAESRADRYIK